MSEIQGPSWTDVDPMFDGHLEKPLDKMTIEERLQWIDEGARMLAWARQARIESGRALPEDLERQVNWLVTPTEP